MARKVVEEDAESVAVSPVSAASSLPPTSPQGLHQPAPATPLSVPVTSLPATNVSPSASTSNFASSLHQPDHAPDDNLERLRAHTAALHPRFRDSRSRSPTPQRKVLTSRYFVTGFLIFGVLVLTGSLTYTILSGTRVAPDQDTEVNMVRRNDWKALPGKGGLLLRTPAQYVVISQTETEGCVTQAACVVIVHRIQQLHLQDRFFDITYNFLVGGDGAVYEGRGWGVESVNNHVKLKSSIAISFIGTFNQLAPSPNQLDAARRLLQQGVKYAFVARNYTLMVDSDQQVASLTGERNNKLYQEIRTWPHWHMGS